MEPTQNVFLKIKPSKFFLQDNNNINGVGTYTHSNGNHYIGSFEKGKMNGNGIMNFKDGKKYVGLWKEDAPDGIGTLTDIDGTRYKQNWEKGICVAEDVIDIRKLKK